MNDVCSRERWTHRENKRLLDFYPVADGWRIAFADRETGALRGIKRLIGLGRFENFDDTFWISLEPMVCLEEVALVSSAESRRDDLVYGPYSAQWTDDDIAKHVRITHKAEGK